MKTGFWTQWIVPSLSNQTYEISLAILNIHSHPTLGNNWTVEFNTTGAANLTITASMDEEYFNEATRWSNSSDDASLYDLRFLSLRCGGEPVPYEWIGENCDQNECSLFVENFTCNQTAYETSQVLTARRHVLKFDFGGVAQFAYNDVNITDACGAALDTANTIYTLNASCTIAGLNGFNITAQNITLDCNGYSITGNNSTGTYGIYTNQLNTTIQNCVIGGFEFGIYTYKEVGTTASGLGAPDGSYNGINIS